MMGAVGRGNGRREGMVTTSASSLRHECNRAPAVGAKMGVGIIRQPRVAIGAMIGQKKPDRPTHETRCRCYDMIGHRQPLISIAHFSLWRSACRCQGCPLPIYYAIRMRLWGVGTWIAVERTADGNIETTVENLFARSGRCDRFA